MSYTSNFNLNQRVSYLESEINKIAPIPVGGYNLANVLTAGNTATNSIALDNTGIGTNVISLLPNATANNPHIELTDGTITNVITKNGMTTRNTNQNSTHFLNFVDNSATGTGAIQKTSGIECNPSTKTITATTFVGDLSGNATTANNTFITSDNTDGSYFIPFSKTSGTGSKPLFQDDTTGALSYNPSTGILTATGLAGSISVTNNNTNTLMYPVFVQNNGSGTKPLLQDGLTNTLTYNPATSVMTATTFSGALSGNATTATDSTNAENILITSDNTSGTYFIPFSKTSGTGDKPLFQDDTTGPLTYNPATATMTCTNINGNATSSTASGSVLVTTDNTSALCFIPFTKSSGTGNKPLFQDDTTGQLTYVPSTGQLTVSRLTPNPSDLNASLTFVERCFIRRISTFGASMGNMNFQGTGASDYAVYMGDNGENNINAPSANVTYPNAKLNLKISDVTYMLIDGNSSRLGNIGIRNTLPTEPLDVVGNIRSSTSVLTPQVGNPSGNLNIRVNNTGAGGTLSFTGGTGLLSGSAGGASGQHLVVTINGTAYKIALLNP